jgi:ribonuclease BN (tRNA processing enzyme)
MAQTPPHDPPTRGRAEIELCPDTTSDMVAARAASADVTVAPIGAHAASARVVLVNGLFGDPTLHLRFRHQRRSLLFDVGESARLQARIAHQVTDLFISHAHIDHISGFLWLLRSRIGVPEPCRVYGPAAIADRVAGMLASIEWDRVGDRAPVFDVFELRGERLTTWRLRAGDARREERGERRVSGGLLLEEPGFLVRAATLDHGGLPVLAFALEESKHLNVR